MSTALVPDIIFFLEPKKPGEKVQISSREVAKLFEKEHFTLLRDLRNIQQQVPDFFRSNFVSNKIKLLSGKEEISHITMTRDGFAMLAMGYNTTKAMQFKVAILARFNVLEKYYHAREGYTRRSRAKLNRMLANEMLHAGYTREGIMREIHPTAEQKREREVQDLYTLFGEGG